MKYQEFNAPKELKLGQLRVYHIPQVPMKPFRVYVKTIQEAKLIMDTLAYYDLFQLEHKIKPDFCNVSGLEVYESDGWGDWYDEEGQDINNTELLKE
jgi:hypothetical protein